jgi:hypothetical protein
MPDFAIAWWIVLLAAIPALCGLGFAWSCRGRRGRASRLIRALLASLMLCLAALLGLLGVSVLGYARLLQDADVARLELRELSPQRFELLLTARDMPVRRFELSGDEWQLDARVLRWQLPAALAGAPPLYRLERVSGRYSDLDQEREAQRTVHSLSDRAFPDLWTLRRQFPEALAFVDADYGSAAYLPMLDGARYTVQLNPRGGLVAHPADEATQQKLREAGW